MSKEECPLCKGPHSLYNCPRWVPTPIGNVEEPEPSPSVLYDIVYSLLMTASACFTVWFLGRLFGHLFSVFGSTT